MKTESTTHPALEQLKQHFAVLDDLKQVSSLLSWDQNTYMPAGAAQARGQQQATMSLIMHQRITDPKVERWLGELETTELPETDAALVRLARREYDKATKLPADFLEAFAKQRSKAQQIWIEARQKNDFSIFSDDLKKVFDLSRQQAEYLGYDDHPYDALHDQYEPGSSAQRVKNVFEPLRDETVKLVKAIQNSNVTIDDSVLRQTYDESLQEQFAVEVVKGFGYNFEHGRLDRTVHPFAQDIGKYDVRITTRYTRDFLSSALFGTMHEAGHAMYEQNIADAYYRTPIGASVSLGIHESQSRLWENLVGRSYGFWENAYPRLQELFPQQLKQVPLDDYYAAINTVNPSFIRVEADEVTYNLHVMIRFELELELLSGALLVKDLPEAWNAKYQEYLGITPPSDTLGCLQDVHWSFGLVGYFPTYALGNLMSVQLFEAAKAAHPGIEEDIRQGTFGTLLGWLRDNVHAHGSLYEPQVLLKRATGSELDAAPYVRYLNRKFGQLYNL